MVPQEFASESLSMHEFFESLGSPYQMFEIASAEGLERAIAEVGRMTNLPTRYEQHLPRKDLAGPLFLFALIGIGFITAARSMEVWEWQA